MKKLILGWVFLCVSVLSFSGITKAEEAAEPSAAEKIYNSVQQDEASGGTQVNGLIQTVNNTVGEVQRDTGQVGAFLKRELERLSTHFCTNFLKLNGSSSSFLSAGYCYGVQPATFRNQNFFQRTDGYMIDGSTGDLLRVTRGVTSMGMGVSGTSAIQFIRQFTDVFKAYLAIPYLPTKLPLSAESVKKLNTNDYASFNTDLNILWDASPTVKKGAMEIGASIYYLVSGSFQVNVYKIDDSHVRFKVIGLRGDEAGANAHLGFVTDLKIFGIHVVDKQITRIFDASNLLYVGMSKAKDTTFVADYTVDLNNAAAAAAYNDVMKSAWRTQTFHAASELIKALKETPAAFKWFASGNSMVKSSGEPSAADPSNTYLSVVNPLDKIFGEDQQMHSTGAAVRVLRRFEGLVNSDSTSSGYQIGLTRFIYSLIGTQSFYENFIQLQDSTGATQNFIFDISKDTFAKKVLFTLRDTTENSDLHALYKTDANNSIKVFEGLGLNYEYKDKAMSVKKQIEVYAKLKKILPPEALALLNFSKWDFNSEKSNARIFEQIIFKASAIEAMARNYTSPAQIKSVLMSLLKSMEVKGELPTVSIKNSPSATTGNQLSDYDYDADEISIRLFKAFSSYEDGGDRRNAFKVLVTEMPLFKEVGLNLMLKMLPAERLQELVYIDVSWSADNNQFAGLEKPIGVSPQGAVYDSMRYVLSLMNKSNFDLNTYLGENELAKSSKVP